jgi:metallo-beta-lactamase class B
MNRFSILFLAALLLSACGPRQLEPDAAFECSNCERWNEPQEPFRIYGSTWYVGTAGLSSILIETADGLILIDGGLPQSAALIDANIRGLGFDPLTISAILLSHAHYDHAGGIAALQRLTGAPVYTSEAGQKTLERGALQEDDPQFLHGPANTSFAAVKNVHAVGDREFVTIGGVDVMAVYTPGHTPGGMSWAWESCALDTCYNVVYADSLTAVSAEGYRFSDGPAAEQLIESAGAISDLYCDILISPHPFFFGMQDKLEKRDEGNPFVNNVACMIYAESALGWLEQRLDSERR